MIKAGELPISLELLKSIKGFEDWGYKDKFTIYVSDVIEGRGHFLKISKFGNDFYAEVGFGSAFKLKNLRDLKRLYMALFEKPLPIKRVDVNKFVSLPVAEVTHYTITKE